MVEEVSLGRCRGHGGDLRAEDPRPLVELEDDSVEPSDLNVSVVLDFEFNPHGNSGKRGKGPGFEDLCEPWDEGGGVREIDDDVNFLEVERAMKEKKRVRWEGGSEEEIDRLDCNDPMVLEKVEKPVREGGEGRGELELSRRKPRQRLVVKTYSLDEAEIAC